MPEAVYLREEQYRLALHCILETALMSANSEDELRQNLQIVRAVAEQTLETTKRG